MILLSRKDIYLRLCIPVHNIAPLFSFHVPISSSSSSAVRNPSVKSPFIVDYLISSVGLSPEVAMKSSKHLSHIKSPSKPDAVLQFLKESGFSDAHIKNIISKRSTVLTAKVDATLKPKMKALRELFSESEMLHLVSRNPIILFSGDLQLKIKFWRNLLRSNKNLLNALVRGRSLILHRLDKNVMPKISFLRGSSISDKHIAYMVNIDPNFISLRLDSMKSLFKQAEELGLPYGSAAFCATLVCLRKISRATLDSKLDLLKSFGWSEDEISLVIGRAPFLLKSSEKKLKDAMEFLVKRAVFEHSYVMTRPLLLLFSLEKRLIPRYHVLEFLKSKALLEANVNLFSFMAIPEKRFMEKYISSYQEKMPELHQIYQAACAGN